MLCRCGHTHYGCAEGEIIPETLEACRECGAPPCFHFVPEGRIELPDLPERKIQGIL